MTIKIDKGVPIQERTKYPWEAMDVGDSFFAETKAGNLCSASNQWAKKQGDGRRFTVRACVEDGKKGARVWRIK